MAAQTQQVRLYDERGRTTAIHHCLQADGLSLGEWVCMKAVVRTPRTACEPMTRTAAAPTLQLLLLRSLHKARSSAATGGTQQPLIASVGSSRPLSTHHNYRPAPCSPTGRLLATRATCNYNQLQYIRSTGMCTVTVGTPAAGGTWQRC